MKNNEELQRKEKRKPLVIAKGYGRNIQKNIKLTNLSTQLRQTAL